MEIEKKFKKKLKGVRASYRSKHIHWKELSNAEFRLLELYTDLTDWDKEHEAYGLVKVNDSQIASLLGCHPSTVGRNKERLTRKGLISMEGKYLGVKDFYKYEIRTALNLTKQEKEDKAVKEQNPTAKMQGKLAPTQTLTAKTQNQVLETEQGFGANNVSMASRRKLDIANLQDGDNPISDVISSKGESMFGKFNMEEDGKYLDDKGLKGIWEDMKKENPSLKEKYGD